MEEATEGPHVANAASSEHAPQALPYRETANAQTVIPSRRRATLRISLPLAPITGAMAGRLSS